MSIVIVSHLLLMLMLPSETPKVSVSSRREIRANRRITRIPHTSFFAPVFESLYRCIIPFGRVLFHEGGICCCSRAFFSIRRLQKAATFVVYRYPVRFSKFIASLELLWVFWEPPRIYFAPILISADPIYTAAPNL